MIAWNADNSGLERVTDYFVIMRDYLTSTNFTTTYFTTTYYFLLRKGNRLPYNYEGLLYYKLLFYFTSIYYNLLRNRLLYDYEGLLYDYFIQKKQTFQRTSREGLQSIAQLQLAPSIEHQISAMFSILVRFSSYYSSS